MYKLVEGKQGWQVYLWSFAVNKWIAQGSPHATEAEAEVDARSFLSPHRQYRCHITS